MKPALLQLDVNGDLLEGFSPENKFDFRVEVTASIGLEGQGGSDYFMITVCTPSKIQEELERNEIVISGHGLLIVSRFDYAKIESFIRGYLTGCSGETWGEITPKLRRVFRWEFDGY
ncbi:MAG TPA: Imm8 family immunity protein [Pseudoxanthomonas sp.]